MKVLIVAEQLRRSVPGGIGTYITGLMQGLAQESNESLGLWASKKTGVRDPLTGYGLALVTSRLPARLLTRAWDGGHVAPPPGWDIVHATSAAVPPRSQTPMTATVHDLGWRTFPDAYPKRGREWHEASLQRAIDRAQLLITPSQATANDLIDGGVDQSQIRVVPLGCDHLPDPDDRSAMKKLTKAGITGDFLLAVGTLEPRKNLARLIAAFDRARPSLPDDMSLVLVGPEGWGDQVKPSERVAIISSATMAEITALYDRCTAFVSVPLLEGFGLPVVEAMSRGVPVVASAVPSAGSATYRVDPANVVGIAEGIVRVVGDEDLRRELIRKGHEQAAGLTWARCARRHIEIWNSLL